MDALGTVKEYGGWVVGTLIALSKFATDRKAAREKETDARIVAVVNPALIHGALSDIKNSIVALDGRVGELQADVAKLEGVNEGRNNSSIVSQSDPRLHLTGL